MAVLQRENSIYQGPDRLSGRMDIKKIVRSSMYDRSKIRQNVAIVFMFFCNMRLIILDLSDYF